MYRLFDTQTLTDTWIHITQKTFFCSEKYKFANTMVNDSVCYSY